MSSPPLSNDMAMVLDNILTPHDGIDSFSTQISSPTQQHLATDANMSPTASFDPIQDVGSSAMRSRDFTYTTKRMTPHYHHRTLVEDPTRRLLLAPGMYSTLPQ